MRGPWISIPLLLLVTGVVAAEAPVAGLVLESRVEPAGGIASGEPLKLVATFQNRGESAVSFFVPRFAALNTFPRWVLLGADGRRWKPYDAPFQSMWQNGIQGEIARLEPGTARSFEKEFTRVVPYDARGLASADAVPLPPGRYRVLVSYEQVDDMVPFSERAFEVGRRRETGLFVGRIAAPSFSCVVAPPKGLTIQVEAPERAVPGRPWPLTITLGNATAAAMDLRGALQIAASSKASGSGGVRIVLTKDDWRVAQREEQHHALHLAPGEGRRVTVDLMAVPLTRKRKNQVFEAALVDVVRQGLFHLNVSWHEEGREKPRAWYGVFRRMAPIEETGIPGLVLELERGARAFELDVTLRNLGPEAVHVPAGLRYPRDLFFTLTRPGDRKAIYTVVFTGGRAFDGSPRGPLTRARVSEPLKWDGDRFETGSRGRSPSVWLPSGGALTRRVDLRTLLTDASPLVDSHGVWEIRAFWRNFDDGRPSQVAPPLVVGRLVSEPLEIRGKGW